MNIKDGDLLLVKTHHFVAKLIRFGQRSYGPEFAQWNHVAIYVGNGDIIEALTSGVTRSKISKYADHDMFVLPIGSRNVGSDYAFAAEAAMCRNQCQFVESCVGQAYGKLTILAIAFKVLFKGRFNFGIQGTKICSGLAGRGLERRGYNFNPWEPGELTPAYLAKELIAPSP